jgi:DNA modification methylase
MEQAEAAGLPPPTTTSVATEIKGDGTKAYGEQVYRVTEAVILAKHLEDPEIGKAKSQKKAMKILRKKAESQHRAKLAETFDQSTTPHKLHRGSAFEILPQLTSGIFDLILTDPPYGVGADTFGDMASTGHEYKDDLEYAMQCYSILARQGFRVTKSIATLYTFCDIRNFSAIEMEFVLHGWDVWPTPLIWSKLNGMLPKPDHGPRKTYEAILMATKGNPHFLKTGAPDVLTYTLKEEAKHGAQKPVELYAELITRSCLPGSLILDAFCGSGTIFPASTRAKVIAHGIEMSEEYYNLALSRMNESSTNPLEDLL